MYILYLDESGNESDAQDKHFILAGLAVHERVTFHLSKSVDDIQKQYFPTSPPIDFHTTDIASGKGFWRRQPEEIRKKVLAKIGKTILDADQNGVILYAAVIEKSNKLYGAEAVKKAIEEISNRFNRYLGRSKTKAGKDERGLIIFSEGKYSKRSREWVSSYRESGTQYGLVNKLSDIPYFANAKESRLLQLADYVAHATYKLYEREKNQLFNFLINRFENKAGKLHGLIHVRKDKEICDCPVCFNRKKKYEFGPWVQEKTPKFLLARRKKKKSSKKATRKKRTL